MSSKVGAYTAKAAAIEGEGDSHSTLVASHAKHATCYTGGTHTPNMPLQRKCDVFSMRCVLVSV